MGSERKSKEEDDKTKKKRTRHSSPQDAGRSKKRKTSPEKSSTKKKHKSHKEMKSETKHKDKHHKRDRHSKVDIEEISSSDYFKKNNEFSTWLKEEKGVFFSDLSADSAREKFLKFVEKWNKGKLPSQYYEGISTGPRTSHNWKIKM